MSDRRNPDTCPGGDHVHPLCQAAQLGVPHGPHLVASSTTRYEARPPHRNEVAVVTIACPACATPVDVGVRLLGIETAGLTLTAVNLTAGPVDHRCPRA